MFRFRPRFFRHELGLMLALLGCCPPGVVAQVHEFVPRPGDPPTTLKLDYESQRNQVNRGDQYEKWVAEERRLDQQLDREFGDALTQYRGEVGRGASLPPMLPVLNEAVMAASVPDWSTKYRDKLVDHVGDSFFMAYTSLLRQGQGLAKRAQRLQAYVSTRNKLLADLRAALAKAANMSAGEQAAFLAGLVSTQAPALRDLETEEESIRLDLTTRAIFHQHEDGIGLPVVQSEAPVLPPVATELLFAVQFEPGLTATQRELLQGVAQDLGQSERQAATSFSFWPARARLPLSADLPAELIAQLRQVQQLKQQLTLALMEVLDRTRESKDKSGRIQALADLADKQAPALESLSTLADEIRPRLAAIHPRVPPPAAGFPPELLRQAERAYARKTTLQRDVTSELRDLRRRLPNDRIELVQNGQVPTIVFTPGAATDKASRLTTAETKALRNRLKISNEELERRTTILTHESKALQKSLQAYQESHPPAPVRDLRQLAASLGQTVAAHENERLYRDYQAAVLQPGLSLEQRRLLLRGALVDIERTRLRDPWAE